ncbi:hypothetical protein RZA67_02995 [Stenotrophomonas sp. C3(2023)]|uniref:hypothetical protein n=1 Tax=Stenotrophomonas sp. C3(2023) TaxID=3080277 RepID=UPI00293C3FFB|nr:hypothetical protein [Stenotrophomonas sp. C3(2023)]MDV3467709.1 hypothetical protein [Stenotrophomonas sp. C3(2023)]
MSPIPLNARCRLLLGALAMAACAVVNAAPPVEAQSRTPAPANVMQPVLPTAVAGAAAMEPDMDAGIEIRREPSGDGIQIRKVDAHSTRHGVKMAPAKTGR